MSKKIEFIDFERRNSQEMKNLVAALDDAILLFIDSSEQLDIEQMAQYLMARGIQHHERQHSSIKSCKRNERNADENLIR
jgi:hypothetical protein